MRVYKSKRVPPFTFFGTVRHFPKEKFFFENFKFFSKKSVLRFLRRLETFPSCSIFKFVFDYFTAHAALLSIVGELNFVCNRRSCVGKLIHPTSSITFSTVLFVLTSSNSL